MRNKSKSLLDLTTINIWIGSLGILDFRLSEIYSMQELQVFESLVCPVGPFLGIFVSSILVFPNFFYCSVKLIKDIHICSAFLSGITNANKAAFRTAKSVEHLVERNFCLRRRFLCCYGSLLNSFLRLLSLLLGLLQRIGSLCSTAIYIFK